MASKKKVSEETATFDEVMQEHDEGREAVANLPARISKEVLPVLAMPQKIGEACGLVCVPEGVDRRTYARKLFLGNAVGMLSYMIDKEIEIVSFYTIAKEPPATNGEVVEGMAKLTCLFLEDGTVLRTWSNEVFKQLYDLVCSGERLPFDPPLEVVVKRERGNGGRFYYRLEMGE